MSEIEKMRRAGVPLEVLRREVEIQKSLGVVELDADLLWEMDSGFSAEEELDVLQCA